MPAVTSHRRLAIGLAVAMYAAVFAALVTYEHPGLGLGHFFYLPVALVALTTGPRRGALAGAIAAALYAVAFALNPAVQTTQVVTMGAAIRLIPFAASGALLGWFARRFESGRPFAILLGDMDGLKDLNDRDGEVEGDEALRRLGAMLANALEPSDEIARVGGDEFAVLAALGSTQEAARLAARLEAVLAGSGIGITFGWAVHPQDGLNALSLYRAADERLYARKYIRSPRRRQTPGLPANGEPTRSLHVAG
jgi:diguanylate cyclase (GGDEF)-like protein